MHSFLIVFQMISFPFLIINMENLEITNDTSKILNISQHLKNLYFQCDECMPLYLTSTTSNMKSFL